MGVITERHDAQELKRMIEAHVLATGSAWGQEILNRFPEYLPRFKKIIPTDYQRMIAAIGQFEEKGMDHEQAELEAFYALKKA